MEEHFVSKRYQSADTPTAPRGADETLANIPGKSISVEVKAGWPVLISPWAIMVACGFAGLIGISFGLYPAHRAARLDPIVALRFG